MWVIRTFFFFMKFVKDRLSFEEKNHFEDINSSVGETIGFSLSSEGEFEQVLPIIRELIKQNKYSLRLIYSSPSLELKINKFQKLHPVNVKVFRLPILTYYSNQRQRDYLEKLIQVNKFIFVRYDFYFFVLQSLINRKTPLILLQAKGTKKTVKKMMFSLFTKISFCLKQDKQDFLEAHRNYPNDNVIAIDFRVFRIVERLQSSNQSPLFLRLIEKINEIDSKDKIIFGSYYVEEKFLLESVEGFFKGGLAVIVPHNLNDEVLRKIGKDFHHYNFITISEDGNSLELLNQWEMKEDKLNIILLNMRGVLCELYQSFTFAYVGGGFGYSVHSILEPYLAGCLTFYGPKNDRSTEKDTCAEIDRTRLFAINSSKEFTTNIALQSEKILENKNFQNNIHSLYSSKKLQSSIDWILE
ncbi:hypothetical protein N9N67_08375 [Bacteriovoracaceae bacterium]|nr:hypothetical protein [Bacteriovoracaceae bacterium]